MKFNRWSNRHSPDQDSTSYNRAYHNFFEGYTETRVAKPNGKGTKILRVYTGTYYKQDMSDRRWKLNRILVLALYLCSTFLFLFSASMNISSNISWYITISETLSFLGLFWLLYILVNYITAPRRMTIGCYRLTSEPLKKFSRMTAIVLGISAILQLVYLLLNIHESPLSGILCIIGFIGSGVTIFILGTFESHITYKKIKSENKTTGDGIEINR